MGLENEVALSGKPKPKVVEVEEEDEELLDPQDTLKESCSETASCQKLKDRYDECNERVNNAQITECDRVNKTEGTGENCYEELIDFIHCVDNCVSKSLFQKLQ